MIYKLTTLKLKLFLIKDIVSWIKKKTPIGNLMFKIYMKNFYNKKGVKTQ